MIADNVCAIVVTYNRLRLLKKCLISLQRQLIRPRKIIVVNNGSSDGTSEWLKNQNDLIVISQENLGGAGGFFSGMKLAHKLGFEWLWLMDDDIYADNDCLLELLKLTKDSTEFLILQPNRYFIDKKLPRWKYGTSINKTNPFKPWTSGEINCETLPYKPIHPIVCIPFEGPLINRKVINRIGFVDPEYFINFDDADFSIRALKNNIKIGLVSKAQMCKMLGYSKNGISLDFKVYYYIRNLIIFERRYSRKWLAYSRMTYFICRYFVYFTLASIRTMDFIQFKNVWIYILRL
jgi:GT2 family glycosyltransferase